MESRCNNKVKLDLGESAFQNQPIHVSKTKDIAGHFSIARVEHTELIGRWLLEFTVESLPHQPSTIEKTTELAAAKIKKQEVYLWLDDSQQPVSMNLVGRPTENGISVSGVYTPKSFRKRGFASAVVAHTSQQMFDSGKKFCVLYTDVANPTSNKIYQQIGYREIATSKHFVFGDKS